MASAEDLRRFATARFLQVGIDAAPDLEDPGLWDMYRLVPDPIFDDLIEPAMRAVGALVEREGWHTLGARLACLNDPEPIGEDNGVIIRKILESPEIAVWPRWFRNFARLLLDQSPERRPWSDFPNAEPEAVAVFQAAMVVAEGLRDPYISRLQLFLQSGNSPLDGRPGNPDANAVFAEFEQDRQHNPAAQRREIQPLAHCVAGLFKLIEIMAAFDNLFVDADKLRDGESPARPESAVRIYLARATANLVTWRFNLRDRRTVNRLATVMDAFWEVCEAELRRHPQPAVKWSSAASYDALIAMLERWRNRADPEPDAEHISLRQLNRSALPREQEAQAEGSV